MSVESGDKQRLPHQFQPGRSGNPNGRPKGSRSASTAALDALGDKHALEIVNTLIAKAKEGDVTALKAIADRVWPQRKGSPVTFDLPDADNASMSETMGTVLRHVSEGELSPEEGTAVMALVEAKRRALETEELAARIAKLEERSR